MNADVYCDTQSGTPLSTNMYTYCGNNSVVYIDPTGYWESNRHMDITKAAGFKGKEYKIVRDWTYNADVEPCESNKYYSTPFHGKSNALNIGKYLYNLALSIKNDKKAKVFSYNDAKGKTKLSSILRYTAKRRSGTNTYYTTKANNAQNAFLKLINVKNYKTQYKRLLGLALHTLQDYFAHVVNVSAISSTDKFYGSKNKMTHYFNGSRNRYKMFELDNYMGIPNAMFEDDINVFRWRYNTTLDLSKKIYSCWIKNKKIKSITTSTRNEYYTYKTTSYWRNPNNQKYETRYWVITSYRYFYTLKTY